MKDKLPKIVMIDSLIGNDYTLCLSLGLKRSGIKLELIVPENREFDLTVPFEVKKWAPAKNDSYGKTIKTVKYLRYLIRVFFYSVINKNNIIHFQFFRRRSDTVLFYIMSLFGVKLIYTAHNVLPHEKTRRDKYLQYLVYRGADAIIVHSSFIKEKLLKSFDVDRNKIYVIPHGNFDIYIPEKRISKKEARRRLGISSEDKVLLFFGFIREYKGLDLLIESFRILKDCDSSLKLLIAGNPVDETLKVKYLKQIERIAAGERIITHFGFVPSDKIQEYFESSDVVVLPYRNIDHSGIVHLAYSFCRPVIASAVGDFPETIENGKSGYVVAGNNPDNLSEVILQATKDIGKLKEMGEYAKKLNDTKYSWDDIGEKTKEVYKRI